MAVLKLLSIKQKISRKSAQSSYTKPHHAVAPVQRKLSSRRKAKLPSILSTFRSSSAAKFLTAGGSRHIGFHTAPSRQPSQRRRIIHVATLNFGPFEDSLPIVAASRIPQASELSVLEESGRKTSQAPVSVPQCRPTYAAMEPMLEDVSVDMTLPSVYSRDSWVEVDRDEPPAVTVVVWSPTPSVEDSGEDLEGMQFQCRLLV